jgi:hypothetical protein
MNIPQDLAHQLHHSKNIKYCTAHILLLKSTAHFGFSTASFVFSLLSSIYDLICRNIGECSYIFILHSRSKLLVYFSVESIHKTRHIFPVAQQLQNEGKVDPVHARQTHGEVGYSSMHP